MEKETIITEVNCSQDMRKALNQNLNGLLTGKRKPLLVKEVNNTLGKILTDVKMEMMSKALAGDRTPISWFDRNISTQKQLK
jgi:hypothetical protein